MVSGPRITGPFEPTSNVWPSGSDARRNRLRSALRRPAGSRPGSAARARRRSRPAATRVVTSTLPPGAYGTTMVMGLVGNAARRQSAAASTTARCLAPRAISEPEIALESLRSACSCRRTGNPLRRNMREPQAVHGCGPLCCARCISPPPSACRSRCRRLLGDLDHLLEHCHATGGRTHANGWSDRCGRRPARSGAHSRASPRIFPASRGGGLPCRM